MIDHMFAPLRNYANFQGRARRADYWWFYLFFLVGVFGLQIIGGMIDPGFAGILVGIFYLAMIVPLIAAGVRRMHDTDRSGWWLLVPIANLIFAVTEGTKGDNRFGPDPKAGA